MTETTNPPGWVSLPQHDFEKLVDAAAERGATRALANLGLENGHAAHDIRELRDLLEAWRAARRTAWQTAIKVVTAGFLALMFAVLTFKAKIFGGGP